jgi:hypothetical protein
MEQMGGKLIRTIGQARANFAMTMMAACYNLGPNCRCTWQFEVKIGQDCLEKQQVVEECS